MTINGKCYFASDFHFGSPNKELSDQREDLIIQWLDLVLQDGKHLFLLGDIFDKGDMLVIVPKDTSVCDEWRQMRHEKDLLNYGGDERYEE